jgi:hypothetical protein
MDIIACKEKRENVQIIDKKILIKNKIFSFKVQNFPKIQNFHKISK